MYRMSTWYKVEVLVTSAILATGKRTVSAVLRIMDLSQERNYAMYHHVLSRAVWSGLEASAILLRLLVKTFDKGGPLVFGVAETFERRRGWKIAAANQPGHFLHLAIRHARFAIPNIVHDRAVE